MDPTLAALGVIGLLLVFVLPGYTWTRAIFPEWRVRGPLAAERAIAIATLAFALSVALTVLEGFGLLRLAPGGFAATWSDPVLEVALAVTALGGFVVGALRGAYRTQPPEAPALEPSPGSDDGWNLVERVEAIDRERRRVRHALRAGAGSAEERARREELLGRLDREIDALQRQREAEYAR
ncbi:MAG TPA: DUF1616 domain-containing protein [Thermoplasmata archaeon]|nr:DUF1616 domain-containing protein [Thermoplasmata archaeon]